MALIVRIIPQGNNKPPVNHPLTTKQPLRLKVARGDVALVLDEKTEKPVEVVEVKKIDKDIHLTTSVGTEKAVLILEDTDGGGISVSDAAGKYSGTDVQVSTARSGFLIGDEGSGWLPWAAALLPVALIRGDKIKDTTAPVTGALDITGATDTGANDSTTKNGNPVLEFTGEAGLVITLKGADGSLLSKDTQYTVSYASGKYTVTLLDAVPGGSAQPFGTFLGGVPTNNSFATADGIYTIVATDGAGNQANVGQFVIDTTAPVVGDFDMTAPTDTAGLSVDDENTSNGLPVLTFKGEAGLTIVLTGASGTELTKDTQYSVSYSNGTYTVTLLDAVPGGSPNPFGTATNGSGNTGDGTYTLSVKDAADNTTQVGTFVIDTTAPTVPTVVAQSTNDTTPTVTGTATVGAGETLNVLINGVTYTTANGLSYNGTTWSMTVPTALTANTYSVTARVTDIAGNTSVDTTSNELVIDTTAPVVSGFDMTNDTDTGSSQSDEYTSNSLPVLTFSGEPGLTITLKGADGSLLAPSQYDPPVYNAGTYTVTLRDAIPGGAATGFGTYAGGVLTGNPAYSADGTYTLVATDAVGNQTDVGSFTIDTTPPVVSGFDMTDATDTGSSQSDEYTSNGRPVITFSGEAGLNLELTGANGSPLTEGEHYSVDYNAATGLYTVTLFDAKSGDPLTDPFGSFSGGVATGNSAATADGTYTLSVKDAANNSATVGSFTIDTTAPATPTVTALTTTSNYPTLTGTATVGAGEVLTVTINGATYEVTPDASGNWSLDLSQAIQKSGFFTPLVAGETYPVEATVTDAAGLSTSDATTNEVTVNSAVFGIVSVIYFNDFGYFKQAGDPLAVGGTNAVDGSMLVQFNNAVATNYADGTKLTWDINGDDAVTANFTFPLANDLTGQGSGLSDRLFFVVNPGQSNAKQAALEGTTGFGSTASADDTMDFAAGAGRSLATGTLSAAASDVIVQYYWKMADAGGTFLGGSRSDKLVGGNGNDTLSGGDGDDRLTLGGGLDVLVLDSLTGADTITDYVVADDGIELVLATFSGLTAGALGDSAFESGANLSAAATADGRIVYDTTAGKLYYDADGMGGTAEVLLGTFNGTPALVHTEFFIV